MVNPVQLTLDIGANTGSLALPGVLWAIWFLLAFEHDDFATSVGFGRKAFWLLLPGSLVASLALLPLVPISSDWLAISFAGALFPLFVLALSFSKFAPPAGRSLAVFALALVGFTALLLVLVLPVANPAVSSLAATGRVSFGGAQDAVVAIAAAAAVAAAVLVGALMGGTARTLSALLAITGGVVLLTFVFSVAIPGVGIEENFPEYLLPPIGAGVVAAAVAPRLFPGREALALPVGFGAATLGVLIGADVLHQPPLYAGGPSGVYAIGGAGVLDLVYLSGLLGLVTAYGMHRWLGRGLVPVGGTATEPPFAPMARLVRSFREGVAGRNATSLTEAAAASRAAALQAGRLLGRPPPPPDRPWEGLPVPGWIVSDDSNLTAAARQDPPDPAEGYRGWLTARNLVLVGRELGARRFATPVQRTAAFAIDLVVVVAPFAALWTLLAMSSTGGLVALVESTAFNAAAYSFIAVSFLYFVFAERLTGTTVGKWLVGLVVRNRALDRPGLLSLLVRNAPLVPALSVIGIGIPVAIAFLVKGGSAGGATLDGVALPAGLFAFVAALGFVIVGIALLGSFGILVIALTSERQRLGDVLAGTWVVRAATPAPPGGPPEPVRSG
jgi:uncharacterized RDD family membrane protein YckC